MLSAALLAPAQIAGAVPASKLAQARTVKAQIEALDARVQRQSDRYGEAKAAHVKLVVEKEAIGAKLKKTKKRMGVVQDHLNTRASTMYRTGQLAFIDVLLGAESYEEFAGNWDFLTDLNREDAASVEKLKGLRKDYSAQLKSYSKKERAAWEKRKEMRAAYDSAQRDLAERQRKLAGLEREIAQLEAAERRARVRQASSWQSAGGGRQFPPPTRAARSQVVDIAKRYLGAPYVWAASGPNSFDCSGLTMFVYRQVGVSLPHSSRAQIYSGQRVSRADLEPGDLVFFGSPIHHVGIYVGGGMMLHAPHTGAVVRIDPMHSNFAGACRP